MGLEDYTTIGIHKNDLKRLMKHKIKLQFKKGVQMSNAKFLTHVLDHYEGLK
jgi:hypothetical protein